MSRQNKGAATRLILVCQDLRAWRSGHDVAVWRLACALAAREDVALTVVTGRLHAGAEIPGARLIRLPCIPIWQGSLQFLSFLLAWRLARSRLVQEGDVVLLSSPLWGGGDAALVHFLSVEWRETPHTKPLGLGSWLRALHDQVRHTLASGLERRAYRRAREDGSPRLLPVSPALAVSLTQRFGLQNLVVLPNICDLKTFHPGASLPNNPEKSLLFIGGAWGRKRLDKAIAALALLPERFSLTIAGRGDVIGMQREANRLGVGGRVTFLGMRHDIAPLMRQAFALLLPSDYETDGLVAWEALASGLPVIASPLPAFSPWLEDGITGLCAATPQHIAVAVLRLDHEPKLRQTLREEGRCRAETRSAQRVSDRLLVLLDMVEK